VLDFLDFVLSCRYLCTFLSDSISCVSACVSYPSSRVAELGVVMAREKEI
jgi:hypothetical protein